MPAFILEYTAKNPHFHVTIEGNIIKVREGEGLPKYETNDFEAFSLQYPELLAEMVRNKVIRIAKS